MTFGLIARDDAGVTILDSNTKFTRLKGIFTVSVGGLNTVTYFSPAKYIQGDIILPVDSTAPFLEVEYEPTRVKLTNRFESSGTVIFALLGFI